MVHFTPHISLAMSFLLAAAMSMILVPLVGRFAVVNGLFDAQPSTRNNESFRKVHSGAIPRLGGVAIVSAFFVAISFLPSSDLYQGVLFGSLAVFICGAIDDISPLSARTKFIVQLIAAGFAIYHDNLFIDQLVLTKQLIVPLHVGLSGPLSIFLVVGAINAINLIDGLDGLAAGVVLIGVGLLAFANFVSTQNASVLLTFALPMLGAVFGFLRYNTHPATIFMGDGGSNWLGFMSGALLLIALKTPSPAGTGVVPFISLVLTFAIPIVDTAVVMIRRISEKRSPFSADKNHFHHSLLRIGLSHGQSVTTIYFLAFSCGVLGIFPAIFPKYDLPWVPYLVAIALMLVIPAAARINDATIKASLAHHATFSRQPLSNRFFAVIGLWEGANRYLLFTILILGPALSGQIPREFTSWAMAAGVVIVIGEFIPQSKRGAVFFDSFAICSASVIILVVNNLNPMTIAWEGSRLPIQGLYNSLFVILFVSSLSLFLATARRRSLIFTPSDFLLLTIPLAILLLPKDWQSEYKLDLISLRSLVIFMSMRVLYRRRPKHIGNLKFACLAALVWVYLVAAHGVRILY